jgi:hypothetical protein
MPAPRARDLADGVVGGALAHMSLLRAINLNVRISDNHIL